MRPLTKSDLLHQQYWRQSTFVEDFFDILFFISKRGTTVKKEVYCGFIQFVSSLYVLAVIPKQMTDVEFNGESTVIAIALACGFGCIAAGVVANVPFIVAPPTSISIFYCVYLQQYNLRRSQGNAAVIMSGFMILLFAYRPLGNFVTSCIPTPIKYGTTLGIGLITALAGAIDIDLVKSGKFTIFAMGNITGEICICMLSLSIIAVGLHYKVNASFLLGIITSTCLLWVIHPHQMPQSILKLSTCDLFNPFLLDGNWNLEAISLSLELAFLYVISLKGLGTSLGDLSGLSRIDGSISNFRWLYVVCGFATVISGIFNGPPILLSAESAAGIQVGAKSGLSTLVCGILFLFSTLLSPIFASIPAASTSSILFVVAILLFQNSAKIDWTRSEYAVPAFCVLFFVPCTYSILTGVAIGYAMFILIHIFSGKCFVSFNYNNLSHLFSAAQSFRSQSGEYDNVKLTLIPKGNNQFADSDELSAEDDEIITSELFSRVPSMHEDYDRNNMKYETLSSKSFDLVKSI